MVSSQVAEVPSGKWQEHIPVLLKEVVSALKVKPGGIYIDCTVGGGGHAYAVLEASSPGGRLLGLDLDPLALGVAHKKLQPFGDRVVLVQANFAQVDSVAPMYGFERVDGILFDLGLSSIQLERSGRGFSFMRDEPLNMRFDPNGSPTAAELVNNASMEELARILERYGEEKRGRLIARRIVESRPIHTTRELVEVIERAIGGRKSRLHPATRTFQALRIATNRELENLAQALPGAVSLLRPGGRLVVISYHSLEDRVVKEFMRRESRHCLCPPGSPVCICSHEPRLKVITSKPIAPQPSEVAANPRSRSARMRVAECLRFEEAQNG